MVEEQERGAVEMAEARRWTQHGHDRLYVTAADGVKLGYLEVRTGRLRRVPQDRRVEFDQAVAAWSTRYPGVLSPGPVETPRPVPSSGSAHSGVAGGGQWYDLAAHRPGQGVAAMARAIRRAHPVASLLGRMFGVRTKDRAWRVGAAGEVVVGRRLRRLTHSSWWRLLVRPQCWWVLHSVPVGTRGADIDHVVVGPAVYTINTKHHPGGRVWVGRYAVAVNGRATRYLGTSVHEAERASRLLSRAVGFPVAVVPILAFPHARVTGASQARGVLIAALPQLISLIRRGPQTLTAEQAQAVYEVARRSDTWVE